jgi:hypothetical protein
MAERPALEVPRNGPFDIVDLARTLPRFPNHPTSDQLYTDQKFEAYRALGEHLGHEATRLRRAITTHAAESNEPDETKKLDEAIKAATTKPEMPKEPVDVRPVLPPRWLT